MTFRSRELLPRSLKVVVCTSLCFALVGYAGHITVVEAAFRPKYI